MKKTMLVITAFSFVGLGYGLANFVDSISERPVAQLKQVADGLMLDWKNRRATDGQATAQLLYILVRQQDEELKLLRQIAAKK